MGLPQKTQTLMNLQYIYEAVIILTIWLLQISNYSNYSNYNPERDYK